MNTLLYRPPTPGRPDIVSDPEKVFGEPTIAGTNITVKLLLDRLAEGDTPERLHEDYWRMPAGSIQAAQEYAAEIEAGRLPAAWAPIIGEATPSSWHIYAGMTDEEIDELTAEITWRPTRTVERNR